MVSLFSGISAYLLFSNVAMLQKVGDATGGFLVDLLPVVLFILLFVTFCKIKLGDLRPKAWHLWLQVIQIAISVLLVWAITAVSDPMARLILEGAFICVICPTAAAAAVVTEKLGGGIASMTVFTIISNVVTSFVIPLLFPMVERSADISFLAAMTAILRNVALVLVVPLALALLCRRVVPRFTDWIKGMKNLGFYLWCFNLAIVSGLTFRNIIHSELRGATLAGMLVLPLMVAVMLFAIGKAVGRRFGDSVSAGQALGQKNTVVGIWLTITFLNPLAAVAPGAYVLWQNVINAWQLWYREKYGKLKW